MFVPEILHCDKNVSYCCVKTWSLPEGPVHMLRMHFHVSGAFNCGDCVSVHEQIQLKRNNTTPLCSGDITACIPFIFSVKTFTILTNIILNNAITPLPAVVSQFTTIHLNWKSFSLAI